MRVFENAQSRAGFLPGLFLTVALMSTAITVMADEGVVSGFFRGSEMKTTAIGEECFENPNATFVYEVITGVTASVSGAYDLSNTGHHYDIQTQIALYTSFDPENPTANRLGWAVADTSFDGGTIQLQSGTDYTIVVQSFDCGPSPAESGEWSFAYRGAGALNGPSIYPMPEYGSGALDSSSPTFNSPICGQARYQSAGPIRVPETSNYLYSDSSVHYDLDIEVYVYEGSFDAANPESNLIRIVDDGDTQSLEEGVDYYLVTAPWGCGTPSGSYQYVLLGPSGEFVITEGVNGAWANFQTLGQGHMIEVYPDIPFFFTAWFTWDTTQPDEGETAEVGDPNHRWLTAAGGYEQDTATLDLYLNSGGLFNNPAPVAEDVVGSMTIQFQSCSEAVVNFELDNGPQSFTINRIANDNNATCERLKNQHKMPVQ